MKIVKKRAEFVKKYCLGKSVLQIGCVGMGTNDIHGGEQFTHGYLKPICDELIGLDINETGVKELNDKGYSCVCHSADEPFDLNRKFDVVLAEEVIEHLFDLRTFMENVKKHMKPDGIFLVVTPNPQAMEYFIHKVISGETWMNAHHTHFQSPKTMRKVMDTFDMDLKEIDYFDCWAENTRGKIFQLFFWWIPNRLARHGVYVGKLR